MEILKFNPRQYLSSDNLFILFLVGFECKFVA
jgi:hypothetical protein